MDLDEDGKNNAPQDIRLLGVRVPASDALTLGFNLFVKSINTLEAPINTLGMLAISQLPEKKLLEEHNFHQAHNEFAEN